MTVPARTGTCRQCGEVFQKRGAMQSACSLECALEQSRDKQRKAADKAQRKVDARRREDLKSASDWRRECQVAFNRYIRARDHGKPCVSSGRPFSDITFGGRTDAGHYRSTGAASHLRFNFLNCWGQSVHDNRHLSGNTVEYRRGLIKRIGLERVEAIENDNAPRTFSIEWLRRAKRLFSKRARYYEKRRGIK